MTLSRLSPLNIQDELYRSQFYMEIREGQPGWSEREIALDEIDHPELIALRHYGSTATKFVVAIAAGIDDLRHSMEAAKIIQLPPVRWIRERIRHYQSLCQADEASTPIKPYPAMAAKDHSSDSANIEPEQPLQLSVTPDVVRHATDLRQKLQEKIIGINTASRISDTMLNRHRDGLMKKAQALSSFIRNIWVEKKHTRASINIHSDAFQASWRDVKKIIETPISTVTDSDAVTDKTLNQRYQEVDHQYAVISELLNENYFLVNEAGPVISKSTLHTIVDLANLIRQPAPVMQLNDPITTDWLNAQARSLSMRLALLINTLEVIVTKGKPIHD